MHFYGDNSNVKNSTNKDMEKFLEKHRIFQDQSQTKRKDNDDDDEEEEPLALQYDKNEKNEKNTRYVYRYREPTLSVLFPQQPGKFF